MFQVPSMISKITTMGDKSLRLQIDTQELSPSDNALVFALYDKLGYFIFKEVEIKPEDIDVPNYVKEFKDDKSPSQRLRAVMFLTWEQGKKENTFDSFYKNKMEEIINHFKKTLGD